MQINFRQIGVKSLLAAAALTAAMGASADPATITAIFGNSVGSNGWTAETDNGITLALRARLRLPTATNVVNTDGNGTYNYNTGAYSLYGFNNLAEWNFDFSVNAGTATVSAYKYVLGIDFSPAIGTPSSYITADLLTAFGDNSFGNSGTATGQGVEPGTQTAAQLAAAFGIVQNSQNFGWLNASFDPTVAGTYSIYVAAYALTDVNFTTALARTDIDVVVATVPEPASLALVGIAGLGMIGAARRRSRA